MTAIRQSTRCRLGFLCVVATAVLTSCPNPIRTELAGQIGDTTGPVITITSPADGSEYSTMVEVAGSVTNDASGDESLSQISSCGYSVVGTVIAGEFTVDADGAFLFGFGTRAPDGTQMVSGPITLQLVATDWNGNTSSAALELVSCPAGDIPGFAVTPASKRAEIVWDAVPCAKSYAILETMYGVVRENVTSPYTWDGLRNGEIYAFQVTAHLPDATAADAVSELVETMPLSPRTFAPWVRETGYRSITLEWWADPWVSQYIVERQETPGGPWAVHRSLTENRFTDEGLNVGTEYRYRVSPSRFRSVPSEHVSATPGTFGQNVSTVQTTGVANGIAIDGHKAYVAAGSSGLAIVDVAKPEQPGTPQYVDTDGEACQVAIADGYAYVADGRAGLEVINLTTLEHVGHYSVPEERLEFEELAWDVDVQGDRAYVAISDWAGDAGGLEVVNISSKTNPTFVDFIDTGAACQGVDAWGSYVFLANMGDGLSIVSLDGYGNPTAEPALDVPTSDAARAVVVDGEHAYVTANSKGLAVIHVLDPSAPGVPVYEDTNGHARGLTVVDAKAYVADYECGLAMIDVSNPEDPGPPVYNDTPGMAIDVAVTGSQVLVCDYQCGLGIIDISEASSDLSPSYADHEGMWARGVSVAANHAYVADGNAYLTILDLANPLPEPVQVPVSEGCFDVEVAGSHAYVAVGRSGLAVIDVSNPEAPGVPAYADTVGLARAVTVAGSYAFVADHGGGLAVVSIDDPAKPELVTVIMLVAQSYDVEILWPYAFVADGWNGLAVVNVSDPENPGPVIYHATSVNAYGIALASNRAFLAVGTDGLAIIDITDPESPGDPQYYSTGAEPNARGVAVTGWYACVAEGNCETGEAGGLSIIDFRNPEEHTWVSLDRSPCDLVISGSTAYLADGEDGVAIVNLTGE
jgi:hypothetical protein